jgi:hypothetical protein
MPSTPLAVQGRALCTFAYDVADEIDLSAVPAVLRPERAPLVPRRPAPAYVTWAVTPLELGLGERRIALPAGPVTARASARLFDFGAVSICLQIPLPDSLAALPAFAESLGHAALGREAAALRDALVAELRGALRRPGANDLVEDYVVFHLAQLTGADGAEPDAERLLREHARLLAGALALDAAPLSDRHVEASLREPLCYGPNDLVLVDWSAAVVADERCDDVLAVLELLNVQLVELRFLDTRLDRALARFSAEVTIQESALGVLRGPFRGAIRALSELTVETSRLAERVENALKLVPDVYLARAHRRGAERLGLAAWQRAVEQKLRAMRDLTTILSERAASRRGDLLEITIIALIALEIVLALVGGIGA